MQFEFRPIDQFPRPRSKALKDSPFRATWTNTQDLLERELQFLKAKNIVIQLDVTREAIRLDGSLRKDAVVRSSAVIVSFDSKVGPLSYPCDRFRTWKANLRAIALALEALRTVDRYGVTTLAEQYKGWQALPPPSAPSVTITPEVAKQVISQFSGWSPINWEDADQVAAALRAAERKTHPDRGGQAVDFIRVQAARRILEGARS